MKADRPCRRELAERSSNGTQVRLLWRHGTSQLWVEVLEPGERVLAIRVQPEQALDAFHHPYAFASSHAVSHSRSSRPPLVQRRPRAADKKCREQ
jgi:hypothetical protein